MPPKYFDTFLFKQLIRERSGISLDESRTEELMDKIRQRMTQTGMAATDIYYQELTRNNSEFDQLVNLLTVNETYFFREPGHIQLFAQRLAPERLQAAPPGKPIKVLSAGCSTGEEPYSLAIALAEQFSPEQQRRFSVIGVDIDGEAIQTAQAGVYSDYSFRTMKFSFPNPFFDDLGRKKYQIKPWVKNQVAFQAVNLLSRPYPALLTDIDFIFYRNVSIYFPPEIQRQVFENLAQLLNEDGYLFVSATETLSHGYGVLKLIEKDGHFIFHKHKAQPAADTPQAARRPVFPAPAPLIKKALGDLIALPPPPKVNGAASAPGEDPYQEVLTLARSKQYQTALDRLAVLLQARPNELKSVMLKAEILVNLNRLEEAEALCQLAMKQDPLCLEAHLLSGMIAKQERRFTDAIKRFKATLYIDNASWLAQFHLAELQQALFENERAILGYQAVLRRLEAGGYAARGLALFHASFSINEILRLCQTRIRQINPAKGEHGI